MSYYQFSGPVQGGFGGFDDDMRKRRKHHSGAWGPYQAGASTAPSAKFEQLPHHDVEMIGSAKPQYTAMGGIAAPRQAAAQDFGKGPEQPPSAPYDIQDVPYGPQDIKENQPAVGTQGLSKHSMRQPEYDPHEIVWDRSRRDDPRAPVAPRTPKRDPEPTAPGGPELPDAPAVQPTPALQPPAALPQPQYTVPPPAQAPDVIDFGDDKPVTAMPVRAAAKQAAKTRFRFTDPPEVPTGGGGGRPPRRPGRRGAFPYGPIKGKDEKQKKPGISWGKDETRTFTGGRHTPGRVLPWVPGEREKHEGYRQLGQMQGRELAKREHGIELERLQKRNRNLMVHLGGARQEMGHMTRQGGEMAQRLVGTEQEMKRRGQVVREMTRQGSELVERLGARERQVGHLKGSVRGLQQGMGREGLGRQRAERMVTGLQQNLSAEQEKQLRREQAMRGRYTTKIGKLQQGMGREGLARQRAEERASGLQAKGEKLESHLTGKISDLKRGMGREGIARQRAEDNYRKLLNQGNRIIQNLEKKINDGSADREDAQRQIDALSKELSAMQSVPKVAPQDKSELAGLKGELAGLKAALRNMPRGGGARGQGSGQPIVVQGGAGGGGASSSAGGSSASSGGGGQAAPARAPDMSGIVEAVKQIAGKAAQGKAAKAQGSAKGITQARRSYTDKRKVKLAELRALKSRRIREFNTKTKKMESSARNKARREFKKKVNAQFKEMQSKFPTARGLKSVGVIRDLIRKIDAIKTAK